MMATMKLLDGTAVAGSLGRRSSSTAVPTVPVRWNSQTAVPVVGGPGGGPSGVGAGVANSLR